METNENVTNSTHERLIATVLTHWERLGSSRISARHVSADAGVPASSIYHHFDSLEQLLAATQREARERANRWCEQQFDRIDELPREPEALAGFFAHTLDEWAETRRDLAFAWRECELYAERSPCLRQETLLWRALWSRFWSEACDHFHVAPARIAVERVFDTLSLLHLIRWRRSVDRAALDELAHTLGNWICGQPTPHTPWTNHAREVAIQTMPALPQRDETARRIVQVAADLLGTRGAGQLTHRLVAQHSGMTLGTVSHKFRTKSDLLGAAFEGVYVQAIERMRFLPEDGTPLDLAGTLDSTTRSILIGTRERARDELFLATARDPALQPFGRQLRYLRGRTGRGVLQSMLGEKRPVTVSEGALFSAFSSSLIRTHALGTSPHTEAAVRAEFESLLALIRQV